MQTKPLQKKCPGLKKKFESHLNTKIKILAKIEHISKYIQSL